MTIIELLVTLAVAAIVLSLALPAFQVIVSSHRTSATLNQVMGAVALARSEAIIGRRVVTLCPASGRQCLGRDQWHQGAMVFVDQNANGRLDEDDVPVRGFPPLPSGDRLYWRSFRNRSFLQFRPRGLTRWQNGSFLYCPSNGDRRFAGILIVNAAGRVRSARDTDGDGIVEDPRGRALTCT